MDRGAWQAMVHRVTKSLAQLSTPHPLRGGRRWAGKRCLEEQGMGETHCAAGGRAGTVMSCGPVRAVAPGLDPLQLRAPQAAQQRLGRPEVSARPDTVGEGLPSTSCLPENLFVGMGLCPAAIVASRPWQVLVPGRVTLGSACTAARGDCGLVRGYLSRARGQAQAGNRRHRLGVDVCRRPSPGSPSPAARAGGFRAEALSGGEHGLGSLQPLPSARGGRPPSLGPMRRRPGQVWGLAGVDGAQAWQLGLGPCGLRRAATVGCLLGGPGAALSAERAEHEGLTRFFHEKAGAPPRARPGLCR